MELEPIEEVFIPKACIVNEFKALIIKFDSPKFNS